MKYIVDFGSARVIYRSLETMPEEEQKLCRLMMYARARCLDHGKERRLLYT